MSTEPVRWLKDGSFLWVSDRSGWKHLYRYKAGWQVRWARHNRRLGRPYRPRRRRKRRLGVLLGRRTKSHRRRRLSSEARWERDEAVVRARRHASSAFQPDLSHYLDSWSDLQTPPQVRVHKADGDEIRVIHESKIPQLADYRTSKPELLQVRTRDGFVMEAMLIKPVDFDPSRKYPVMQFTYGGPGAASVANAWDGETLMVVPVARPDTGSSSGCATTGSRAARARNRSGQVTRTSENSSCATSRTDSRISGSSRGWMRHGLESRAGASGGSWSPMR